MDIHKPHAPHSWGEFLREIGVIVCGVLVALGFEQGVQWLHDRHVAHETRASLRAEIGAALGYITARGPSEHCVGERLNEVAGLLDRAASGQSLAGSRWIGAPPSLTFPQVELTAATASGGLRLLAKSERRQIADIYENFAEYGIALDREWYAWGRLRALEHPGAAASEAERARLQDALQEARTADYDVHEFGDLVQQKAGRLGIRPLPRANASPGLKSVCLPLTTSRAEAAALFPASTILPE